MNLDKVKTIIQNFSKENDLKLFDVSYLKNDQILSVLFDNALSLSQIEEISNKLSTFLDDYEDEFVDNYILDVSTVGVERPIRNEKELSEAIEQYIYVRTKENEYNGTLKTFENGILELEIMDKNRKKNVSVEYKEIKQMRYAVKF